MYLPLTVSRFIINTSRSHALSFIVVDRCRLVPAYTANFILHLQSQYTLPSCSCQGRVLQKTYNLVKIPLVDAKSSVACCLTVQISSLASNRVVGLDDSSAEDSEYDGGKGLHIGCEFGELWWTKGFVIDDKDELVNLEGRCNDNEGERIGTEYAVLYERSNTQPSSKNSMIRLSSKNAKSRSILEVGHT